MHTAPELLARRAARGDGDAFELLCRTLQDDVWRYCRALSGDHEVALEAAQETFLRLVSAIRRFRGDGPVRVFVLVIARRAVAEALRRELRSGRHQPLTAAAEPAAVDHSSAVDLQLLLAVLPTDPRQAFVLTQLLGLSYDDAARVTGHPIGTIRSRVFRARQRLVAAIDGGAEEANDAH